MTPISPRVAVVGAGPAGLTAAHRLQRAGVSTVVYEARPEVGGRMRTDSVDGFRIDTAAQLFGSMFTEFFRVLGEAGAGDLAVRSPGRDALWRNGRAHDVVYGSVTSMLASGGLSMRTKMRLGTTYLPFLTRHAGSLDLHAPERMASAGLDRESIAAWGTRELGSEFVEYLAYPLLAAYHGLEPEETSAALYHLLARSGRDVVVFALRGGAASFCHVLETELRRGGGEVRTSTPVSYVEVEGDEVRISGDGWEERFDGVVIAVPAPTAATLADALPVAGREWLGRVRYRPAVSLALLLDAPVGVRYFGLSFPRDESKVVAAICVEENKAPGLVPENRGLLVVFPTPAASGRLIDAEGREVLDAVLPEVRRAFPAIERRITRAITYRWAEGWPVYSPGYFEHLQAVRGGVVEREGRVCLAGDYLYTPNVEGAVFSGTCAAERLLQRLSVPLASQ